MNPDGAKYVTKQLKKLEDETGIISDPVTYEAITDRLVSRAIKIQMKGGSYRPMKTQN